MTRAVLLILSVFAIAAAAAPWPAEARSKAYCRDLAQQVADRNTHSGDVVDAALAEPGGALIGAAVDGQGGEGQGAVIGGGGGSAVTGIATSEHWQQVYRRAYAECRAG